VVMECPDYINLNGSAVKLLIEMACQFKGEKVIPPKNSGG